MANSKQSSLIDKILMSVVLFIYGTEMMFTAPQAPHVFIAFSQFFGGVYLFIILAKILIGKVFK